MPALQVKDCPTEVYERLRANAAEENRSISQQVLTIIEDHLGMRSGSQRMAAQHANGRSEQGQSAPVDYVAKRKRAFERISSLKPIPASTASPDTATLLAQIRREEAR